MGLILWEKELLFLLTSNLPSKCLLLSPNTLQNIGCVLNIGFEHYHGSFGAFPNFV